MEVTITGLSVELESQLKNILLKNNCSFEKYLSKFQYIKTKDDIREELFLTPVVTAKKLCVLFITRVINGNWFESIKDIEDLVSFIVHHYNYQPNKYRYFLHIYISNIKFEQFYTIDIDNSSKLGKISIENLEKILKK
ncbi:MAG TPA: hypothetical protein VG961_14700 [Ignavibacteria bacterium]|nr:hypothetical protein [Ignavibacteria bacterium]